MVAVAKFKRVTSMIQQILSSPSIDCILLSKATMPRADDIPKAPEAPKFFDDSSQKSTFHPAFFVTNIKNIVPPIFDQTNDRFVSWVELFTIVITVIDVLDHIDPKAPRDETLSGSTWNRLDALVKLGMRIWPGNPNQTKTRPDPNRTELGPN
uniref:Uncharacterized protein n=1 Tax=Lactuca sativa TaxID=4236 RepID=A0A9R1W3L2_LACSA|nr:hypothetical protein LSAT_V11C300150980 [Lactuca sativa]